MALSSQTVVSNGTLVLLDVALAYFSRDEVTVRFNNVPTVAGWAWVGTTEAKIAFTPAVPAGVVVRLQRSTSAISPRHVFGGGAAFLASVLDENFEQTARIAQEMQEGVYPVSDIFADIRANGSTLTGIRDAAAPQEPASLAQLDARVAGNAAVGVAAAASEASAASSAAAASVSAANALASQNAAADSAGAASASAAAAAASAASVDHTVGDLQAQTKTAFTTAGAAGALTVTSVPTYGALAANQRMRVKFSQASTGADTLNRDALGAKLLKQYGASGGKVAAIFAANQLADVEYDGVDFVLLDALPPSNVANADNLVGVAGICGYGVAGASISYGTAGGPQVVNQGSGAAMLSLNRAGAYAVNIGIDTDNVLKIGGWSMGANAYPIYHAGNPPPVVGVGQTWVNVTASRAKATSYVNTTGRTIAVAVSGLSGGTGALVVSATVDGQQVVYQDAYVNASGRTNAIFFLVPSGATYSVDISATNTVDRWFELRS